MSSETSNDFLQVSLERDAALRRCEAIFSLAQHQYQAVGLENQQILRPLTKREILTLEQVCRCKCNDWSKLRLLITQKEQTKEFSWDLQALISDTRFEGIVILDMKLPDQPTRLTQTPHNKLPPGIHSNMLISNSLINVASCRIYRNSILSSTLVGPHCTIMNCGTISSSSSKKYGVLETTVGAESGGGRRLLLTSEQTMLDICHQLQHHQRTTTTTTTSTQISNNNNNNHNILSQNNLVTDTPTITNIYLHEYASIRAATSVNQVTMLPSATIGNSCIVSDCLLQWNSAIMDHSTLRETLLMEQSHSGPNSTVTSSVLGPDVHVSCGEIHASIIGPNTNAHHQSLIISVLWPLGRGNVGYGANIGSNHTGRLPDQETASGEGTFWGLSTVIKMPLDLTYSPYSIVAAGVSLSPQRICMPFSLIISGTTTTEIIPGWVLQSSPYTLARSETKFSTRRKAKRHSFYTGWKIIRQEIVEMCVWARHSLKQGDNGTGSNTLSDRARTVGLNAYTDCIQRYALQGLLTWLCKQQDAILSERLIQMEFDNIDSSHNKMIDPTSKVEWPTIPWDTQKTESEWDYQKVLLVQEYPMEKTFLQWLEVLLKHLIELETDYAKRIHKSKSKDDTRGASTIPGYAQSHLSADQDPVIVKAREAAEQVEAQVNSILGKVPIARSRL